MTVDEVLKDIDPKVKECQGYLLMLLKYVDGICEKEGIDYSLFAGSMLGACRHKGFIPWDDDADIMLTRDNYDRLLQVLRTAELPADIGVWFPDEHDKFYDFVVRIYYKGKKVRDGKLCNEWYEGIYSYATLDLFVFDHIPDNALSRKLFFFRLKYIYGLAMGKRETIKYEKHGFIEKLGIKVLSVIGKNTGMETLYRKYDSISKSCKNSSNYNCTTWSPVYFDWLYDAELYKSYIKTTFEDTELKIVESYKKILAVDYGEDYMTPKITHLHGDEFLENGSDE